MEIGYALMQQQSASYYKASISFGKIGEGKYDLRMHCIVPNSLPDRSLTKPGLKAKKSSIIKIAGLDCTRFGNLLQAAEIKAVA